MEEALARIFYIVSHNLSFQRKFEEVQNNLFVVAWYAANIDKKVGICYTVVVQRIHATFVCSVSTSHAAQSRSLL